MERTLNRKLVIVIPTAYLTGGVQTWLNYLVPGLEARDWAVTVLGVHGHMHDAVAYFNRHPFRAVHKVINTTGTREGRVRALMRALQFIRPDIVLSVNIFDVYEAVARLRRNGVEELKVAMALHGFNGEFFHDIDLLKDVLDGVITTNRLGVAAASIIGGLDQTRAMYAPCGVDISEFREPRITVQPPRLLYSGRFDQKEKHVLELPVILKVLEEQNVPFRLMLAGSGPDESVLRSALSCFGDRVEFVGQLDEKSLHGEFYQPGAILVITSPSESGPLVAWEAMVNGVAVVTSDYLGMGLEGSLCNEKNCLVFPVSDTNAAAACIARLQNTEFRNELIREGFELIKKKYDRAASVDAWHKALCAVMTLPPLSSPTWHSVSPQCGRLDKYFGIKFAESMRSYCRLEFRHSEPGSEWPHSYSEVGDDEFFKRLLALDRNKYSGKLLNIMD